ncbi:unnamed protein product [Somion occarium]|uniref:Uncharacterized protein n=1 Tax=Somion occarium TaxID=3059160 RepID=A0ABP1DY72_9APHY
MVAATVYRVLFDISSKAYEGCDATFDLHGLLDPNVVAYALDDASIPVDPPSPRKLGMMRRILVYVVSYLTALCPNCLFNTFRDTNEQWGAKKTLSQVAVPTKTNSCALTVCSSKIITSHYTITVEAVFCNNAHDCQFSFPIGNCPLPCFHNFADLVKPCSQSWS